VRAHAPERGLRAPAAGREEEKEAAPRRLLSLALRFVLSEQRELMPVRTAFFLGNKKLNTMPPPVTPAPVEPVVETEPAYWFRRVGELSFARPSTKGGESGDGGDGDCALPSSSRRVSAAPAAGVVAFSDGTGELGGCICGTRDVEDVRAARVRRMQQRPFLRCSAQNATDAPPRFFHLSHRLSLPLQPNSNPPAVYLARTAALLAAAVRVEEGR
jgi:hypothetical protein